MTDQPPILRTAILGASGYTGAELLRLLRHHPAVSIAALTADRMAGQKMKAVFPHIDAPDLPLLVKIADVDFSAINLVFCALPHGTTQSVIAGLPDHVKIIDLSADFRLANIDTYADWYGHPHQAVALQGQAVYGLTEFHRPAIAMARLVANPGCYPTATLLPLLPLLVADQIDPHEIIVDAKSGVSGAGRAEKQANLFTEIAEGMHAYGVGQHRHMPEIEQELSAAAGRPVVISFTPHLIPMNRGMLATTYVRLKKGVTPHDLRATLIERYVNEPFVTVMDEGAVPATRFVRGTNRCLLNVFADRRSDRAILVSVIDNLVKGASGQAVQNLNVMLGLDEKEGLDFGALFP
jgi:N-acetyl-gamma-glutamyl-phosphate reductase